MRPQLAACIVALLLAGCASPAPTPTTAPSTPTLAAASVAAPAANETTAPAPPLRAFLQADGTLAAKAPATQSSDQLDTPANTPATGASPEWSGTLAAPARVEREVVVTLYASSSSASFAANVVPAFDYPRFSAWLTLGNVSFDEATADGPDTIVAGQVAKFVAHVKVPNATELPAGTPMRLEVAAYYSHFQTAADFHFLVGGDTPSGFEVMGGSSAR